MAHFVWIPEAPDHPGLYANKDGTDLDTGKVQGLHLQPSTMDPRHALQFSTEVACQQWCDDHPTPVFVPKEHGFGD